MPFGPLRAPTLTAVRWLTTTRLRWGSISSFWRKAHFGPATSKPFAPVCLETKNLLRRSNVHDGPDHRIAIGDHLEGRAEAMATVRLDLEEGMAIGQATGIGPGSETDDREALADQVDVPAAEVRHAGVPAHEFEP